jgi:heat shock protein HslJ
MYFFDKETAERVIRQDGIDIPDCVQILQYEGLEISDDLLTEEEKELTQTYNDELTWSQWWAVSINGTDVVTDTMVTMFLRQDGEITGSSGCNWYGCRYNQKGRYIRISGSDITNMGCAEDILAQEESFLTCLRSSYSFEVAEDTLVLYDDSGKVLVICERLPRHQEDPEKLIGINWRLVSVDGEEVADNESGTIFFDPDSFSLHGEDTAFTYEYGYEAKGNVILFTGTRTTRKRDPAGGFIHGQGSVLRSLFPTVNYRTVNERLELYLAGKITLVFEPVEER